ncbi:hypothetical protein [Arthrobacter sp. TWP1-1]|uniref:hypothetical protein n=1 Tax=Arthrobacter sp. TWP1-1 TaxID=2804568 RepID=UPI003CF35B79
MITKRSSSRWAALAAILLFAAFALPAPASAMQDPGTRAGIVQLPTGSQCALTRIGNQFVRCDALTGAGADAPSWVPER